MNWRSWADDELAALRAMQRLREPVAFEGCGPAGQVRGRDVVSFASNDYLGLASHPRVCAAARAAIDRYGTGAMASRLVVGTRNLHLELENSLAAWKGAQRALVFPSGYAANLGVLTALGERDVTIFSDALNHASIIDGCRLAKAQTRVYRHADVDHLMELMAQSPSRKIVVTESVFSMDGDRAPLEAIAQLCLEHHALLVVDAAHAVLDADRLPMHGAEVLHVGTLSKTLGALGGFVAGARSLIELLTNRARTFIYTTALSPADTAAAQAALSVYESAEGAALRQRLRSLVDSLEPQHPSAILPVILGEDAAALAASARLLEQGIHVPAIRPPTVPPGTARLRIALSASHTDEMIARLRDALVAAVPAAVLPAAVPGRGFVGSVPRPYASRNASEPEPTNPRPGTVRPVRPGTVRPDRLIGVVGTHTEVGKTWVTSQLLALLKTRGLQVAARKPVQSYEAESAGTDAQLLAAASGESVDTVCPPHRCYPLAMAPPMAANLLRRKPILLAGLIEEIVWPAGIDVGFVETVGGARSPLAHDGDSIDLLQRLQVDEALLVADAGLGTINAVRVTLACLAPLPVAVFLNRYDPDNELHRLNRAWLLEHDGIRAITRLADWH